MGIRTVVSALCAVALAVPAAPQEPKTPVFASHVEMVSVTVSVTDKKGKPVGDLGKENFLVLEDQVRQDIMLFESYAPNLDLVLMVDASGSMGITQKETGKPYLHTAKEGAKKFLKSLRPGDRALVVDFAAVTRRYVNPDNPFTDDPAFLEAAVDAVKVRTRIRMRRDPRTGEDVEQTELEPTSLYDGIYAVLKEIIAKRPVDDPKHPRRAAVILITDGEDTASLTTDKQARDEAKAVGAPIYSIMIARANAVGSNEERRALDAKYFLMKLAQESGGSFNEIKNPYELRKVYTTLERELQTHYRLAYASSNPAQDGAWRLIQVAVSGRPELTVRHRSGYYASATPKSP